MDECVVGGHPQHTQTSSNSSTMTAGSSNSVTNTRCCRQLFALLMMGDGTNPKHVEQFPDKINCVTLHLVGYILEYYYDARTRER